MSSWGGLSPLFGPAYGVGQAAADRLMAERALQFNPHAIFCFSTWPGIAGTEGITSLVEAGQPEDADGWKACGADRFNWETPLLSGRAIAALAADPGALPQSGKVPSVVERARR